MYSRNKIIRKFLNQKADKAAAVYLNKILQNNFDKKILFLLSGGSAFKLLEGIDKTFLSPNLTISVLDERFSTDPGINNFLQLSKTNFYKDAKEKSCCFIETIPKADESLKEMAARLESEIRRWKLNNPKGIIIITQGIGPDGHTAGIMPYPEDEPAFKRLFESEAWVVSYDALNKNQFPKRVTTTITFLIKEVDYSVVYAVGKDKQEIINRIVNNNINLARLPASVIKQMKNAQIFTE